MHIKLFSSPQAAQLSLLFCWKVENQQCCTSTWDLLMDTPPTDRDRKEKRKKKNQLPMGFKLGISRSEVFPLELLPRSSTGVSFQCYTWCRSGRGGSSSGSTPDYFSRGPKFDSRWELGFFSIIFSFPSVKQWCVLDLGPRGGATPLVFQLPRKKK